MDIEPRNRARSDEPAHHNDGRARWLLGLLGLLAGGVAIRVWRGGRMRAALQTSQSPATAGGLASPARPLPKPTRGHESRDASVAWIFGIVLFLLISGLVIHGILAWFLSALKRTPPPKDRWQPIQNAAQTQPVRPSYPVLQVSAPLDLQAFHAKEQAELDTYAWLNRTAGVVRIPVAQAMEAVLKEGLPTRTAENQDQTGPSSYQLTRERSEQRGKKIQP